MNIYEKSEKWLRLVTLIDYAGRQLCQEVLHKQEGLPCDGAQLYSKLEPYKGKMQYEDQKKILCPSNGITDESKFDLTLYTKLISVMYKPTYDSLIQDLRDYRNHLYHMGNKDMSESTFDHEWKSAYNMLQVHNFTETMDDLKKGHLPPTKELRKIEDSLKGQIQGSVKALLLL